MCPTSMPGESDPDDGLIREWRSASYYMLARKMELADIKSIPVIEESDRSHENVRKFSYQSMWEFLQFLAVCDVNLNDTDK